MHFNILDFFIKFCGFYKDFKVLDICVKNQQNEIFNIETFRGLKSNNCEGLGYSRHTCSTHRSLKILQCTYQRIADA